MKAGGTGKSGGPGAGRAVVIGAGFAGLSAACHLRRLDFHVTLLDKNAGPGGRARTWSKEGYTFDMGPSWYWMPDVFERFFAAFGKAPSDYYRLERIDPSYRIYFGGGEVVDVPAGAAAVRRLFESYEKGAGDALDRFLRHGRMMYRKGMGEYVLKPGLSPAEFLDPVLWWSALRYRMAGRFSTLVRRHFAHPKLRQIVEFPVLFLGAPAERIPAMYSLMTYADVELGTWYPAGGMAGVAAGAARLASELGVESVYSAEVTGVVSDGGRLTAVTSGRGEHTADVFVAAGDYRHFEQVVLPPRLRTYPADYWESRVLAPSSLIFYLGIRGRLDGLAHHTFFFDEDLGRHTAEIYDRPSWPAAPLFYVCRTTATDPSTAPEGCENVFVLVPVAPGLGDTEEVRAKYRAYVMEKLERHLGRPVADSVEVERSYAHREFIDDYHSFKGNAYGLANTLRQTAILKPKMRSRTLSNLFYAGQLTVPGPGVPPSLVSGEIAATVAARSVGRR